MVSRGGGEIGYRGKYRGGGGVVEEEIGYRGNGARGWRGDGDWLQREWKARMGEGRERLVREVDVSCGGGGEERLVTEGCIERGEDRRLVREGGKGEREDGGVAVEDGDWLER
ncbi:hypothetical protein RRG08_004445 [Elysia crispata]|uniref:Uncharacterized protein n=1 Tax=Elysia crispata TaxID=231223 RepID=A0AAE1E660_9GAST|nr:hypothetical protein RRG08_004445 [Elysia crispata]